MDNKIGKNLSPKRGEIGFVFILGLFKKSKNIDIEKDVQKQTKDKE